MRRHAKALLVVAALCSFFANSAHGDTFGPDQTFSAAPGSLGSPGDRGYELVSPPEKGNSDIYGVTFGGRASIFGSAAIFTSLSAFGEGVQSNVGFMAYRGVRGAAGGWTSRDVMVPVFRRVDFSGIVTAVAWSDDLGKTLLFSDQALTPGGVTGRKHFYVRDNDTGALTLITLGGVDSPGTNGLYFTGATPDFSHILFESCASLVPGAPELPSGCFNNPGNLYEWVDDGTPDGELRLASVLPNGEPAPEGGYGGAGGLNNTLVDIHAISDDGSRVFWWDPISRDLLMRVDGEETVRVSASQRTVPDPAGPALDIFMRATPDGSKLFFTSGEKLTDDSTAVHNGFESTTEYNQGVAMGGDLYVYDVASGELTDLSVAPEGTAQLSGVLGVSDDGETVYFAARGEIAPGSDAVPDADPSDPRQRIYRWHGGTVDYVATIENSIENGGLVRLNYKVNLGPGERPEARVTPDGRYLTFWSQRSLTGYETAGFAQYYRYDALTDSIVCVSCNPRAGAAKSTADITAPGNGSFGSSAAPFMTRMLTPDGRVFFSTREAMVGRDTNGQVDVYEWDGAPRLVSDGESPHGSYFADASRSGDDLFLWTRARLSDFDYDTNQDLYDARVGGGDPRIPPLPAACEGDACQSPPTPPLDPTPASASFHGSGNPEPRAKRVQKRKKAPKRKARRHHKRAGGKAKARAHRKPSTRSHG